MTAKGRVLIVDQSNESREVLKTALLRRGLEIWEAAGTDDGLSLARQHHPDLIVLDLELDPAAPFASAGDFQQALEGRPATMLLLGTAPRQAAGGRGERFVPKPYHYAPLIHKIEQLLEEARQAVAPAAA